MKMSYSCFPNSGMLQRGLKENCVWHRRLKKTFLIDYLKDNIVIEVAISQKELRPNFNVLLSFKASRNCSWTVSNTIKHPVNMLADILARQFESTGFCGV